MNVEFLIHGTLQDGQSSWREIDTDYCSRFYTPTELNELMVCEITKREDGGISSYYSYLRYNNLNASSGRSGSYFGMTVRVDNEVCCDVANMYHLLDVVFTKSIVGTILSASNNTYTYTCHSFKVVDTVLQDIEKKFYGLFSAMFISDNDFLTIPDSYSRKGRSLSLNLGDVTKRNAQETLLSGYRLTVSPYVPNKQLQNAQSLINAAQQKAEKEIQAAQENCERQIQAKVQELELANKNASSSKSQLKQKIKELEKQLQSKINELEEVKGEFSKQKLNTEINQTAKELKEPIMKLAGLMAERFRETNIPPVETNNARSKKNFCNAFTSFRSIPWKSIAIAIMFILVTGYIRYNISVLEGINKQIASLEAQITSNNPTPEAQQKSAVDNPESKAEVGEEKNVPDVAQQAYDYSKLLINIIGKNSKEVGLKQNKSYTFQVVEENYKLVGNGNPENGVWAVNKIRCPNGQYTVTDAIGTNLEITYSVNGEIKITRSLKVTD